MGNMNGKKKRYVVIILIGEGEKSVMKIKEGKGFDYTIKSTKNYAIVIANLSKVWLYLNVNDQFG